LATVGSVAPFVGLFGTVWGIMRSFTAIASQQNTSLSVVAPGIAEALFATAIGLFAAIPAVIAYNRFGHGLNRLEARLTRFADGFHALLSRKLES
jgi:biopolymer transport protein TolQ